MFDYVFQIFNRQTQSNLSLDISSNQPTSTAHHPLATYLPCKVLSSGSSTSSAPAPLLDSPVDLPTLDVFVCCWTVQWLHHSLHLTQLWDIRSIFMALQMCRVVLCDMVTYLEIVSFLNFSWVQLIRQDICHANGRSVTIWKQWTCWLAETCFCENNVGG